MIRISLAVAFALLFAFTSEGAEDQPGIVREKPVDGPAVETDSGWMVPYETVIPGTEVTFRMVPIPAGEFTMGSPADESGRGDDEGPQRHFKIPSDGNAKTWRNTRPIWNCIAA